MTWKNRVRDILMGATYEEIAVVAPAEAVIPLVPIPLDLPQPMRALEESLIQHMRRAEFLSDAPVLSAQDPIVQTAGFRDRFGPQAKTAQAATRARLQLEADAPVAPRSAPLLAISDQQLAQAEVVRQRAIRRDDQSMVPVARKDAA
jgi:hypothetical protein